MPVGILAVDGKRLVALDGAVMRGRRRGIEQGAAVATIVLDQKGRVMARPKVSANGLLSPADDQNAFETIVREIEEALAEMTGAELRDDSEVHEVVRLAARRGLSAVTGKKPAVDVHLVRI